MIVKELKKVGKHVEYFRKYLRNDRYRWLGNERERERLITAAIRLRKHIEDLGIRDVVFIETSSRPIATLLNEIDIIRLKSMRKKFVERAIRDVYPHMNSRLDEKRLRVRRLVKPGSVLDKLVDKIRYQKRLRVFNLSTPYAFEFENSYGEEEMAERMRKGYKPIYAIFRERANDLFTLIFVKKVKVMVIDDFVETGSTMREIRDFLKKIAWIHERIGEEWEDENPECYKKAEKLRFQCRIDEINLDNVYFASLYGHERFEMPDWVFIGMRTLYPPPWHASTRYRDHDGESRRVGYTLESVIQRRGYPWGTPIEEVNTKREYAGPGNKKEVLGATRVVGTPYSPLETPFLPGGRMTNLMMAISEVFPTQVFIIIDSENGRRHIKGKRPMTYEEVLVFLKRLKDDENFLREKAEAAGYDVERVMDDVRSIDPEALVRRMNEYKRRPEELRREIMALVREFEEKIIEELGR